MLECKFLSGRFRIQTLPELIDTCWNVNYAAIQAAKKDGYRINRYMLECKLCHAVRTISDVTELIDTCWNVNGGIASPDGSGGGINRYMLECKYDITLSTLFLVLLN